MDRIRGFLAAVAAVAFIGLGGREVRADEVATIVNKTNKNVSLYLQWSHLDYESDLIVLGPGDRLRQAGPDGATLSMRFNSTPGVAGDPREIRVQVITRNVPNGAGPGFISYFRNRTPAEVDINDKQQGWDQTLPPFLPPRRSAGPALRIGRPVQTHFGLVSSRSAATCGKAISSPSWRDRFRSRR